MKHALIAASLVLVAGTTAGCGGSGGSDAPKSASTADFCKSYNSLFDSFAGQTEAPSDKDSVKAIKDWASEMKDTGTPKGMPSGARHGLEVVIDTINKIDDNASQDDIAKLGNDLKGADKTDSEAFGTYATKTCPTKLPSDVGSPSLEAPSDPSS